MTSGIDPCENDGGFVIEFFFSKEGENYYSIESFLFIFVTYSFYCSSFFTCSFGGLYYLYKAFDSLMKVCIGFIIGLDFRFMIGSDVILDVRLDDGLGLWFMKGLDAGGAIWSWFLLERVLGSGAGGRIGAAYCSLITLFNGYGCSTIRLESVFFSLYCLFSHFYNSPFSYYCFCYSYFYFGHSFWIDICFYFVYSTIYAGGGSSSSTS